MITVDTEREYDLDLGLDYEAVARQVCQAVLDHVDCPYECQAELLLTDDSAIRQINRETREIDRATDVLSFPMVFYHAPGDFSGIEEEQPECFSPESGCLCLGDMVISLDKVREQAEAYGHSVLREYAFLLVHSMLHLCGYDHMEESQQKEMEEQQRRILDTLGITRE